MTRVLSQVQPEGLKWLQQSFALEYKLNSDAERKWQSYQARCSRYTPEVVIEGSGIVLDMYHPLYRTNSLLNSVPLSFSNLTTYRNCDSCSFTAIRKADVVVLS